MPRYEFRCRACGDTFEVQRPMSEARVGAVCPSGHDDTVKLLSTVAIAGSATQKAGGAPQNQGGAPRNQGGCCGGSCGC